MENKNPIVTIEMENGDKMVAELYPHIAPNTVNGAKNVMLPYGAKVDYVLAALRCAMWLKSLNACIIVALRLRKDRSSTT